MKLFLSLALRNVFRHRARTVVALAAIAAGCAALIVNGGIIFNIFRELREDAIRGRHGHLQIYRHGYSQGYRREPERYLIPRSESERILALVSQHPRVTHATRRRQFSGMISYGDRYVAFVGLGVEPALDAELSRHLTLDSGEPLDAGDPYGVLAGFGLAEKCGAEPGAILTLLTHTASGALNAVDTRLRGVFQGGLKAYDDWTLKVPLEAVEELLLDDRTEQIVLLLERTEDVPAVRRELEALFGRQGLELETRSWDELALFHNQVVALFRRELEVIELIIATIVILGIANTIGMSILERRIELATMRALGLRAATIGALLMSEALLIGLIGGVLGVAAGLAAAETLTAIGIPFPSPPGSTRPFVGGVDIVAETVLFAFLLSLGATLAAAVLPVWRALRQPIAETLKGS